MSLHRTVIARRGRPPANTTSIQKLREKAESQDIDPLIYMLRVVGDFEKQARAAIEEGKSVPSLKDAMQERANELRLQACDIARACCPYLHPKLQSVVAEVHANVEVLHRDEQRALVDKALGLPVQETKH